MLVGAVVLAAVAAMVYGMARRPGTAQAVSTTYAICMNNPPNGFPRCLDDRFDARSADNPIQLGTFDPTNIPQSEKWGRFKVDTVNSGTFKGNAQPLNTRYSGQPIYYLEKKEGTGHDGCIGIDSTTDDFLGWETCGDFGTQWVYSGNEYFVSVGKTNQVNSGVAWLMSLQENPQGVSPHCQSNPGNQVQVAPQGSGNCNFSWAFAPI
jgi:hypothetical protein